jgi:GTP diphosphokinase / guanosine-3',5'-bis(diphosphate) 3'-diphosphatase
MKSTPKGVELVVRAAQFAAHKHSDQRRKDAKASPYINHPLKLAEILVTTGGVKDAVTLAAALLHDTIEDTQTDAEELRGKFGDAVASVVEEVTDVKWLQKGSRKRLQVMRAGRSSKRAKLVKLADKIANLENILASPPADWSLERKQQYFDWAKSVVDQVGAASPALLRRFRQLHRKRPSA